MQDRTGKCKKLVDESEKERALRPHIQFWKADLSAFHLEKDVFQMSAKELSLTRTDLLII